MLDKSFTSLCLFNRVLMEVPHLELAFACAEAIEACTVMEADSRQDRSSSRRFRSALLLTQPSIQGEPPVICHYGVESANCNFARTA